MFESDTEMDESVREHVVAIGLGSNLGDRRANLAEAIQRLDKKVLVDRLSSCYESNPMYVADQPEFLNMVACGRTTLSPRSLLRYLKRIEEAMGRLPSQRYGPRLIDLDILLYDDAVVESNDLTIPHARMMERPFVLVPLAEVAPDWVHPVLGTEVARLADRARSNDRDSLALVAGITSQPRRDVQGESPRVRIELDRVGATNVKLLVPVMMGGRELMVPAEFDLFVSLHAEQRGAHLSRLMEALSTVVHGEVVNGSASADSIPVRIAQRLVAVEGALESEVRARIQFPLLRRAPVSRVRADGVYTWVSTAAASVDRAASVSGVIVECMTACPCAQDLTRTSARERLVDQGLDAHAVDAVLEWTHVGTHTQRAKATLTIGAGGPVDPDELVEIVEDSASSELSSVLKRPDELFTVGKAHRRPRFAEDVVREMISNTLGAMPTLLGSDFLHASLISFESIHRHDVFAELSGTVSELVEGHAESEARPRRTTLEVWLDRRLHSA